MDKCCAKTNQMGLLALTMMTASNMMGSGVFMLPATLARIGSISVWGWGHFGVARYQSVENLSGVSDHQAIINAATISLWGFLGIESASVSFSQVKKPRRTIPLATLLGLGLAGLCYASSTNVMMGLLPHDVLMNSSSPFADSAKAMWGNPAGAIISAMVVLACLGAMPGWQILQTEVPRAAAEDNLLPAFFARTNRHSVPWCGLVFTAALMTALLLFTLSPNLQNQFQCVITLAISASLLPYAFAAVSLPVMMVVHRQFLDLLQPQSGCIELYCAGVNDRECLYRGMGNYFTDDHHPSLPSLCCPAPSPEQGGPAA